MAILSQSLIKPNNLKKVELKEVIEKYQELNEISNKFKIKTLYPTQTQAIEKGALEKSFLLASGTASGKTLIAQLASFRKVLDNKKVLYLVPLRSLAFEKFEEFKKFPFRTTISVGEMDKDDHWLRNYDIIISTYEKAESLIRHKPLWIKEIGLVVFDEAHELARKPLIETLAIKFAWTQILLLSATIGNVSEIADWLGIDFLESDFRPIPLKEGILKETTIHWKDNSEEKLNSNTFGIDGLISNGVNQKKQTLIFTNTRREAESTATRSLKFVVPRDKEKLNEIANKIENVFDTPTKQCKKLANLIRGGVGFHHAGLVNKQRILVETAFRTGLIPVLASTVTLVAGLNLPSRRVIIKSPHFIGKPWPVSLYKQAAGRSGRPGYDEEGESIIIHKNPDFAKKYYIEGKVEDIRSPLAYEPTLRREIIGLFASGFSNSKLDLENFMKKTFYAFQHGDEKRIVNMSNKILEKLIEWKMIEGTTFLKTTKLGQRVAETYLDPQTAKLWLDSFENSSPLGYIHLMAMSNEIRLPSLRQSDKEELMYSLMSRNEELLYPKPDPWDIDYENYFKAFKLALILENWINEKGEDYILERFEVSPGDLRSFVSNAEWLSHGMNEIIKVGKKQIKELGILTKRIKHGVKKEVVELAELPGIGRVRARRLFQNDITIYNISKQKTAVLEKLIGKETTKKIKSIVGKKDTPQKRNKAIKNN